MLRTSELCARSSAVPRAPHRGLLLDSDRGRTLLVHARTRISQLASTCLVHSFAPRVQPAPVSGHVPRGRLGSARRGSDRVTSARGQRPTRNWPFPRSMSWLELPCGSAADLNLRGLPSLQLTRVQPRGDVQGAVVVPPDGDMRRFLLEQFARTYGCLPHKTARRL
jgi:hypothetical protein